MGKACDGDDYHDGMCRMPTCTAGGVLLCSDIQVSSRPCKKLPKVKSQVPRSARIHVNTEHVQQT